MRRWKKRPMFTYFYCLKWNERWDFACKNVTSKFNANDACSRSTICRDYSYAVIKRITTIKNPLKFPNTIFIGCINSSLSNTS